MSWRKIGNENNLERRKFICPHCHSSEVDHDSARGDTSCSSCGYVLDETSIDIDVEFQENDRGSSTVVGQFVSSTGNALSNTAGKMGYDRETSRDATIANGRKEIARVASLLGLSQRHIEAAHRLFMLAIQHNFIQGRRTLNVVAACLYIVCRREKSPHLLIDFSDVLRTNLHVLGATFLKFVRLLNLHLPLIDPSLYIHRFAAQLELGELTHTVAMTALRLVGRMKRDWIQIGRRPASICGSCLLIACKIHGFKRQYKEVTQVVRICEVTLRRRLTEFRDTSAASITLADFRKRGKLESLPDADPPAFKALIQKKIIIKN